MDTRLGCCLPEIDDDEIALIVLYPAPGEEILAALVVESAAAVAETRPSSASRSCFSASRYTASPCSRTPAPGTQSADFQAMKTPSSENRSPSLRAKNSPICRRAKKNPATTTTRAITTKPSKIHKPRRRRTRGRGCGRRLLILCLYYQPCATGTSDQCGGGGGERPRRGWVSAQPRPVS